MACAPSTPLPPNCWPLATQWRWVSRTCLDRSRNQGIQPMLPSDRAILISVNSWNRPEKIHDSMHAAGRMAPMDMLAMNGEFEAILYMVDEEPRWMAKTCPLDPAAPSTG